MKKVVISTTGVVSKSALVACTLQMQNAKVNQNGNVIINKKKRRIQVRRYQEVLSGIKYDTALKWR